jgi:hypothetical protein
MNRMALLLVGIGLGVPSLLSASVDTAWVRRYDGPAHGDDWATRIAVDTAGNVYVTGASSSDTSSGAQYLDFVTIKYYPNGDTAWVRRADFGGKDIPYGLGVDAQGNVYVAGTNNHSRMVTVKYNSAGTRLWSKFFGSQGGASNLALDHRGDVVVCGYSLGATMDGVALKYRPDGDTSWARFLDWAGYEDYAIALATGGPLDVVVVAEGYNGSSGSDYVTVKYDSAGTQQWLAAYTGPVDWDTPEDVATDAAGNVYVAGSSVGSASSRDFLTIKYDSAGETLWTRRYDGPANGADRAQAVAVASTGSALVAGWAQFEVGNRDYTTVSYDSTGTQVWVARYDGPAHDADEAYALAVDASGSAYVTGWVSIQQSVGGCVTIKYDRDGDTVWVATYVAPPAMPNYGAAIAVGADGSVYVAGNHGNDILTIKYVQNGGVAEESPAPVVSQIGASAAPNPFATRTEIRFGVPNSSLICIQVLDVSGRVVRTLDRGPTTAGWHSAVWDGADDGGARVPVGVYVVVLEAGAARAEVKVVMSE